MDAQQLKSKKKKKSADTKKQTTRQLDHNITRTDRVTEKTETENTRKKRHLSDDAVERKKRKLTGSDTNLNTGLPVDNGQTKLAKLKHVKHKAIEDINEESDDSDSSDSSDESDNIDLALNTSVKDHKENTTLKHMKKKRDEKLKQSKESSSESESEYSDDEDGEIVDELEDGKGHDKKGKDSDSSDDEEDDVLDEEQEQDVPDEEKEEDEYAAIKKELANIPLEDLMKIKEKIGLKAFNKLMHGGKFEEKGKKRVFSRENKNRPMEMSSKRPVPIVRKTEVPKAKLRRDPRFDDLSGEYKEEHFERNYSFLDDVKTKEKQLIQKKLKKMSNEDKKVELQKLLSRMNQQDQTKKMKHKKQELETAWKHKEKEMIKEGKTPYFLKKADKKKLELADKFKELQKSGKMDQYLSKKRKKNAQKERKKLPGRNDR